VARRQGTGFPSYEEVGEAIRRDLRLTYLYPAEQTGNNWQAWLPRYEPRQGLVWQREDDQDSNGLPDRVMRSRLLVARPGTAIDPASDAAAEGTLRETECMGEHWRTSTGDVKPVGLVGYLLVREGSGIQGAVEEVEELFLGGDTRYGLGRVRRVAWDSTARVFSAPVSIENTDPALTTERVLAHAIVPDAIEMRGGLEVLAGWDRGVGPRSVNSAYWRPGSVAGQPGGWRLMDSGLWAALPTKEGQAIARAS